MALAMRHFVIVFDRSTARILDREEFPEEARVEAWASHDRLVRQYVGAAGVEVVLFGSESEATLRRTHGRYFDGPIFSEGTASPAHR